MADDRTLVTLNRLIENARDAERGFRTASGAVADPALRRLFMTYAHQRADFARELSEEVARLGGTPVDRGSVAGALHRAFLNLRAAVGNRDERAVIAEAERGEAASVGAYRQALGAADLPA